MPLVVPERPVLGSQRRLVADGSRWKATGKKLTSKPEVLIAALLTEPTYAAALGSERCGT
jgi:hypothetical protein